MEHGRPATFRNECEAVGQCFGTVNNSLTNGSFVSISAGSVVLLQALFHICPQGQQGLIRATLTHWPVAGL